MQLGILELRISLAYEKGYIYKGVALWQSNDFVLWENLFIGPRPRK